MTPYLMFVRSSCRLIANNLNLDAEKSIKKKKILEFYTRSIAQVKKRSDTSSIQTEVHLSIESGLLASFYSYSFSVIFVLVLRDLPVAKLCFLLVNQV